jgi:5,10-methenyltetrahydrofolate synthetase
MTGKPSIPPSPAAQAEQDSAPDGALGNILNVASPPPEDKGQLRKRMLAQRRAIDPRDKTSWDDAIGARLLALLERLPQRDWGVYWPLKGEPDLMTAYPLLAARGVRLYLPVVVERDAPLAFAAWTPGEGMHKDSMGIAVPESLRLGYKPNLLLIPCLGWNKEKYRLGYGGGFYDRTLAQPEPPLTVGVAYACMQTSFASEAHDVALDLMITERNSW